MIHDLWLKREPLEKMRRNQVAGKFASVIRLWKKEFAASIPRLFIRIPRHTASYIKVYYTATRDGCDAGVILFRRHSFAPLCHSEQVS